MRLSETGVFNNMTNAIIITDYLNFLKSVRGLSVKTIKEYSYDLEGFLKFQIIRKIYFGDELDFEKNFNYKDINKIINTSFLENLNITDFYAYLSFLDNEKDDNPTTRSRKISALKSFYKYLYQEIEVIDKNITEKLRNPKISQRQPVYLTLNETERLLDVINTEKNTFLRNRDMTIVFTFLTTGMRLSELVSINISDIYDDHFKIIGKGNKERTIYLTDNALVLIHQYLKIRNEYLEGQYVDALFISTRKKRISNRAVQATIEKYLRKAGFDTSIYSTHKLRHTAATLMYKYGNVDIRALKDILGHANVSTTQIYTHLDNEDLKNAVKKNPLSNLEI